MNREIISFNGEKEFFNIILEDLDYYDSIYEELYDEEDNQIKGLLRSDFEIINEEVISYDLEDSYEIRRVIVKRLIDNKYFEGYYSYDYYNGMIPYKGKNLVEVFPREITKIIYE